MREYSVMFYPPGKSVKVKQGTTLLEAARQCDLPVNTSCGGNGICGGCKMIVKSGLVRAGSSAKLSAAEREQGYVLACLIRVENDLEVTLPPSSLSGTNPLPGHGPGAEFPGETGKAPQPAGLPLVRKHFLQMEKPSLGENMAFYRKICTALRKEGEQSAPRMGLDLLKGLPSLLEDNAYAVTATVGVRENSAEIINLEGGDTRSGNYRVVVDIGTTTLVAQLVAAGTGQILATRSCFNSQGTYGRDVTNRIIAAESSGDGALQKILVKDINGLVRGLAADRGITCRDIPALVCAGNTIMIHFLLGLPTRTIRRSPYPAVILAPPPLPAAAAGLEIAPRGLLYTLPGISGWVGGDISAGVLSTGMHLSENICLLVDVGTNGEIIVGNREWLMAASASAGPALEGAGGECGMRAEEGAIERVFTAGGEIRYETIGKAPPRGICGSGMIDLIAVLLREKIIDRAGKFIAGSTGALEKKKGIPRFVLVRKEQSREGKEIFLTETDINNVILAKAAIYAAMKILLHRLDLGFADIHSFYLAGAFGNYIDTANAVEIGLIPRIDRERIRFVGNTSLRGAKLAAADSGVFGQLAGICGNTTYYDLMGAEDYVEEFKQALFLPHTNIEEFSLKGDVQNKENNRWQK